MPSTYLSILYRKNIQLFDSIIIRILLFPLTIVVIQLCNNQYLKILLKHKGEPSCIQLVLFICTAEIDIYLSISSIHYPMCTESVYVSI